MSANLRFFILIAGLILFLVIVQLLRKEKIFIKFSFLWFFSAFLLAVIALFPDIISFFRKQLGFETSSNMVIGIFIFTLLFITIALTVIVSSQKTKIQLLIQEVSILKQKIEEKDEK